MTTDLKDHDSYSVYKKIREYNESRELYLRDKLGLLHGLDRSIEEKIRNKFGAVMSNTDVDKLTNDSKYSKDRFKTDVTDVVADSNIHTWARLSSIEVGQYIPKRYGLTDFYRDSSNKFIMEGTLASVLKEMRLDFTTKAAEKLGLFQIKDGIGCEKGGNRYGVRGPPINFFPKDDYIFKVKIDNDPNSNKSDNLIKITYAFVVGNLYYFYQALSFLQARKISSHFPTKSSSCFTKFDANTVKQLRLYISDIEFGLSKLFEGKNLQGEAVAFKSTLDEELSNYLNSQLSVLFGVKNNSIELLLPSLKATEDIDLMISSTPYEVGQLLSSVNKNDEETVKFLTKFIKYYKKYTNTHPNKVFSVMLGKEQLSKIILAVVATNELNKAITRDYIVMKFMEGRSGDESPQQYWEKLFPTIDLAHAITLLNSKGSDVKETEDALDSIKTRLVVVANKTNSVTPGDIKLYTKKKSQPDKTILELMVLYKANKGISGDMTDLQMDVFIDTGSWSRWAKNMWSTEGWKVGVGVGVLGAAYLGYKLWNREEESSSESPNESSSESPNESPSGSSVVANRRRSSNRKSMRSSKKRPSRRRK